MESTRYSDQMLIKSQFSLNPQISNSMKIRPLGAELFQADGRMDGRTDTTKLKVAFRNFANAFTNGKCYCRLKSPPYYCY